MSQGKYLSLEEARKGETKGATIKRFCDEHPTEGDEKMFDNLFEKMVIKKDQSKPQ